MLKWIFVFRKEEENIYNCVVVHYRSDIFGIIINLMYLNNGKETNYYNLYEYR